MSDFARKAFFAALLAGTAVPAFAADYVEPIPVVPVYGGWYIRGYIGMSNQFHDGLDSSLYFEPSILDHGFIDEGGWGSAGVFGAGVGYQFNDWFRGDLTVEYRGKSDFHALDFVTNAGGTTTNDFTASKSEWLVLANAYVDAGNFSGVVPYVGVGLGASRNTISDFRDVNILNGGGASADEASEWDFAWALHAGVGFEASERLTIDLGYSFISMGGAHTGTLVNDDPIFDIPNDGFRFNDIYSHDFKLGVRYALD